MGRVIARVAMLEKPKDVLMHVLALVFIVITVALGSLSIPPWEKAIYTGSQHSSAQSLVHHSF
jgi:hypothetical protein